MSKIEWISLIGIAVSLVIVFLAGWINNEARISTLENEVDDLVNSRQILVMEILESTKSIGVLKGMHMKHLEEAHAEE